jgi:mRNA interferase MazF
MPARCWDVVRVDFPYADEPTVRARPALVVATPNATEAFSLVWVLMITSARHAPWPWDVAITDLAAAGLPRPSLIRTAKIASLDGRLAKTVGHLSPADRRAVTASLKQQLGDALTA